MSTTTAQRRKPPLSSSSIGAATIREEQSNQGSSVSRSTSPLKSASVANSTSSNQHFGPPNTKTQHPVQQLMTATVRRRKFGTSPFDENWLNLDGCGLFCACMTYALHVYGVYAVNFILIPPWMSYKDPSSDASGTAATDSFASSTHEFQDKLQQHQEEFEQQQQQRQQQEVVATDAAAMDNDHHIRHLTWIGWIHCTVFFIIAVLAVISHFKAMTTDPGAVPPDAKPIEDPVNNTDPECVPAGRRQKGLRLCRRCNSFKPSRAHHCSICKRCIIKMDHHCPWVNNCVGIGNHKYFLLFIFYTFLSCCYSIILVIWRFWQCIHIHSASAFPHHHHHHRNTAASAAASMHHSHGGGFHAFDAAEGACLDQPQHLLNLLGLLVEGLLFGMFTSCMMIDQSSVVRSRMTHIDRLKKSRSGGGAHHHHQHGGGGDGLILDSCDPNAASSFPTITGFGEVFGIRSPPSTPYHNNNICMKYYYQCYSYYKRLHFLSPFVRVTFPPSVRDEIMGYYRPACMNNNCANNNNNGNNQNNGTANNAVTNSTANNGTNDNSNNNNDNQLQ